MADDRNKKFKDELAALSDDDLETMASTSPGMSNIYVRAEVLKRRKKKEEEEKGKLNYTNSPKEE
jgi:hypothetical protein